MKLLEQLDHKKKFDRKKMKKCYRILTNFISLAAIFKPLSVKIDSVFCLIARSCGLLKRNEFIPWKSERKPAGEISKIWCYFVSLNYIYIIYNVHLNVFVFNSFNTLHSKYCKTRFSYRLSQFLDFLLFRGIDLFLIRARNFSQSNRKRDQSLLIMV